MLQRPTILLFFLILIHTALSAQSSSFYTHHNFDKLLNRYVNKQGGVNYEGFKKEKNVLDAYVQSLKENPVKSSWGQNDQLAYWINLYNALTLQLIIKNYPLESITSIEKAWDTPLITLSGKAYTLNNIENDIIRPQYKEPRIHFALNCAARSCPKLLNEAFTGAKLNSQLEKQAKEFINNFKFNKLSQETIEVSKIFEWYSTDFYKLISYLNQYSTLKIDANASVNYMPYNWKLNKQ